MQRASRQLRKHTNSFDVLRLLGAALVLWFHQHLLLGIPAWPPVPFLNTSVGILGVFIFFSISGYLNTLSIAGHHSVRTFLINRALRIYPALAVCVLFTVVLAFFFATDLHAYLSMKLVSYVVKDVTLLFGFKLTVPGVFETSVFPEQLNGSLWTLPYEVKMYVALAAGLAVCRYSLFAPILLFAAAAATLTLAGPVLGNEVWVQFATLFLAGSTIASIELLCGLPVAIAAVALIAGLAATMANYTFADDILLTAIVIMVGHVRLPPWLRPPIDLSYSLYLYGFPVQQAVALYTSDFWPALALSTSITLALATLSLLYVELPALRLKKTKTPDVISVTHPAAAQP